jgi:hypothetical protein
VLHYDANLNGGGMVWLYTFAFFGTVVGLWRRATTVMERQGRGWFFRNWIGGTLATFMGIVVLLFATADSGLSSVIGFALAIACASTPWWPDSSSALSASPASPSDSRPALSISSAPEQVDAIGTITFDYLDARGNESHRTVEVTAVDDEYFEGLCFTAGDTRTFVIARVQGKVMDVSTGELLTSRLWATKARKHPRNGVVSMGGKWTRDDHDSVADDDLDDDTPRPVEILFTGFPKAQRQELEDLAELRNWKVVKSVTVGLTYLCTGPNAGPAKIAQAVEVGAEIIDLGEYLDMSAA